MQNPIKSRIRDASNFDDYLMALSMAALLGTLIVL